MWIVAGAHGEGHEDGQVAARRPGAGLEVGDELLDRAVLLVERPKGRRHLRQIAELEGHVAGMAGGGGPEVGVLEGVEDRAVAARRLAEDPAPAGATAPELGNASRRERGCESGWERVWGGRLKQQ